MPVGRLLLRSSTINKIVSRNAFTASKPDPSRPNMLRVGLAFGSTAFLWGLLFKQHSTDVREYKIRNGLEVLMALFLGSLAFPILTFLCCRNLYKDV